MFLQQHCVRRRMMKKVLAKRILIGLLTVIMISAGVLPFLVKTANVANADENAKTTNLTEGIALSTNENVKDSVENGYVKVTFVINDDVVVEKYIKENDTVTVKSTDSKTGVLVGDSENGSAVNSDTTIYVKTYKYEDVLDIKKELVSEEPDEDGYYTLKFTVNTKNLPSIHSATRNETVLVIDASLSMACAVDFTRENGGKEYMAGSYGETRWKAMYDAVDTFLDQFLPEGNVNNKVALVIYNQDASKIIETPSTKKSEVMSELNGVFNETLFNNSQSASKKDSDGKIKVDDMTEPGELKSKTNVKAGLEAADEIFTASDNTSAKSVILFTDGVANRPNEDITVGDTQYSVGDSYPVNGVNYTVSSVNKDNSYYVDGTKFSGNKNEFEGCYYANLQGQKMASENVAIYSFALMKNVDDNVKASMGYKNVSYSQNVINENIKKGNVQITVANNFEYTADGTGYARKFCVTTDSDVLKNEFKSIIVSMKELPFDSAFVKDTLDEHFELVKSQDGITDNGDGTFTIAYKNSHFNADGQEVVTAKIKAKDGYAGYSYTNNGCKLIATVDGLTYEQKFEQTPAAVILPDAVDDTYSVNQGETLNAKTVTANDGNKKVNNPDKNVSITTEKVSDVKHGQLTFNQDGTFTYIPDEGFSGTETFIYKNVLKVNGKTYEKEATVTITVAAKQPVTEPSEPATKPSEPATKPSEPVTKPSEPATKPSESVTEATTEVTKPATENTTDSSASTKAAEPAVDSSSASVKKGEVGADTELVTKAGNEQNDKQDSENVQTGDKSNMMLYVLMIIVGVAGIAAVIAAGRKKSEE